MSHVSSEQIAKALKGAGLSTEQRIIAATDAWKNDDVFFPNKDEFLFEWLCTALSKPNIKNPSQCCLFQPEYWQLLTQLLQHYDTRATVNPTKSPPVIRAYLVMTLGTVLQKLYTTFLEDSEKRTLVLEELHTCTRLLFSTNYTYSYRPTLEHMTVAADQVTTALGLQLHHTHKKEERAIEALAGLAQIIYARYDSQLVQAANQKKVFTAIVGKSFSHSLAVRRQLSLIHDPSYGVLLSNTLTDIINHALFHTDTILEYTSVLRDSFEDAQNNTQRKQTVYVWKLFEELSVGIKSKNTQVLLDTLDILPHLFSTFVTVFRTKRNVQASSGVQDGERRVEFGFFIEMMAILNASKHSVPNAYLKTLSQLLEKALHLNLYIARNDDIAKFEQTVLHGIADATVSFIEQPNQYDQTYIFDVADKLLHIDLSFMETRIGALWPALLNPTKEAKASCLAFATSVLHIYSASRQMDVFVNDFLEALYTVECQDAYQLLCTPLFSKEFLTEFSLSIHKSMPAAQALVIFERFVNEFNTTHRSLSSLSSPPPTKRTKNASTPSQRKPMARWIAMYFVEFVGALRLSQHQRRTFVQASSDLFEQFVKPSLEQWLETRKELECTLLPALHIHLSLTNALFDVYWKPIEEEKRLWLAGVLKKALKGHSKVSQSERVTMVSSVNALLQHAYYTSLVSGDASVEQITEWVNSVLHCVIGHSTWKSNASWNGALMQLDSDQKVGIACWKLITDEWFDVVSRFVNEKNAKALSSRILLSQTGVSDTPSEETQEITLQKMNEILLRSANFYEARCLKEYNIKVLLDAFVDLFSTHLLKIASTQSTKTFAHAIAHMDRHKPLTLSTKTIEELTTALAQCTNSMDQDVKEKDTKNVEHVASFIKLFLLFPLEYYEKNERQQVMLLAFLADAWVLSTTTASAEARITASLLCRGLHLRATSLNSSSSVLNIHPDFLYWFVQSVNEWTVSISTGTRKVLSCLQNITTEIDQDILSTAWSLAGNKSNDMRASTYVEGILKQCITSLDSSTGFYNASTCSWAISILEVTNKYLRSHNKKNTTMDPEEVVYSSQVVSRIGTYVITALKKIQIEISALLERLEAANSDDEQNQMVLSFIPEFTKTKHVLTMTYLLQDYAHALGTLADSVVDITQVSKSLVVASSPFIQFMQMSLRPSTLLDSELKRDVLNITTSFITAFCTTLSRYQQLHTTKRVVAVIWFVYTMVSNSGDLTSIDTLSKTFSTWIQTLSKDDFEILIQSFIEQSEEEVLYRKEQNRFDKHRVFLDLLRLFIQNSTDAQKHVLRKWLPTFILKQSLIVGKTTSIELLDQTLSLVVCITGAKEFSFTSYDLSIVLSCLLQVASPDALERFKGQAHRETVQSLFIRCCDVLSNLLRSHRDALVDVMPSFSAIVQALMHCFKSTHLSLIGSKATENKKRKAGDKQQKDTAPLQSVSGRSMTLFSECAPLDDKCCEKYARLLDLISQKNPATQSKSNAASAQTLWRVMAKYAPYLLMEYFTIQSNSTMSIARAQIKAILTPYFYQLLDMCNDADRSLIMAALDGSGKALFKAFFASWKDNHKYIGQ